MYAIVEIAGQQFKVEEGRKIFVHRLETEKDKVIEFEKVLLVEDNDKILVGDRLEFAREDRNATQSLGIEIELQAIDTRPRLWGRNDCPRGLENAGASRESSSKRIGTGR